MPAAGLGAAEAQRDLRNLQNSFPLPIYGDGEQTRDFIFVKDVVAANAFIATQPKATGVFNVAYGKKITINELCATICRLIGSKSEIKHATERAGDVKHSMAAIDVAESHTRIASSGRGRFQFAHESHPHVGQRGLQ